MTHLFKIPLTNSDMFVKNIDFINNTIEYHIRDNTQGKRLEPDRKSTFEYNEGSIWFDNVRHINEQFAQQISQLLNS